jgi:outer membrane protein OmpA-like peptidoglycan-associated protein
MKKGIFLLVLLMAVPLITFAQEKPSELTIPSNKYQVMTNKFFDNWFIEGGIGGQLFFGDGDGFLSNFGDRIAPSFKVAAGKWFTPGLGLRVAIDGISLKRAKGFTAYKNKNSINYIAPHVDAMFDIKNMLYGYNSERKYSVIPYAGFGAAAVLSKGTNGRKNAEFAAFIGVINKFKINDRLDFNLEVKSMIFEDGIDGDTGSGIKRIDPAIGIEVGLTYRLGDIIGFAKAATVPTGITEAEMSAVQNRLNEQIAKNEQLMNDLVDAKNAAQRPVEPKVMNTNLSARIIFFQIGKAHISIREKLNIKFIAEQIKATPNKHFTVTGYADKATGSKAWNQKLSERRAEAVAKMLVEEYGVNKNQIKVVGKGGVDDLFNPVALNRAVVVE